MKEAFDYSKEYGIVLEGGGAKGAYQIGVWKALKECNVKIKGIAGVSVGALNGVLICMDDVELAEQIWTNITYSQVMDVDDEEMEHLLHHDLKNLKLKKVTISGAKAMTNGGFDITPLRKLLSQYVDEARVKASETELIIGTLSLGELKGLEIEVKELPEGELNEYLIASASLPVFKQEKLQGKTYLDGGMVNNVPIDMLLKRAYKDIIVVRIFGIGVERKVKIPEDVNVIEISPRVDLGNILEFNPKKAERNIKIGYFDAMRVLQSLEGKIYYIREVLTEEEHLLHFVRLNSAVKMVLIEYFKEDYSNEELYIRKMNEIVLPGIAEKLGLGKNWTYTQLYLSMLELSAKVLRVMKYKIYSEEEFIHTIQDSYIRNSKYLEEHDLFTQLIVKAVAIPRE